MNRTHQTFCILLCKPLITSAFTEKTDSLCLLGRLQLAGTEPKEAPGAGTIYGLEQKPGFWIWRSSSCLHLGANLACLQTVQCTNYSFSMILRVQHTALPLETTLNNNHSWVLPHPTCGLGNLGFECFPLNKLQPSIHVLNYSKLRSCLSFFAASSLCSGSKRA